MSHAQEDKGYEQSEASSIFATADHLTRAVMHVIEAAENAQRILTRNEEVSNMVTMAVLCLAAGGQIGLHNASTVRRKTDQDIKELLSMAPADLDQLFTQFGVNFLRLAAIMKDQKGATHH